MATWVRAGTGTAPSASGANLTGTYQLDNATAPADFDPDAVSSVRFQWTLTGSGFSDDTWTDVGVRLTDGTNTPATAAGTGGSGLGNGAVNNDVTDSSVTTGFSAAQWEGMDLQGNTDWATYQADKMNDGATIAASSVTVTITYTPDASQNITPGAVTVNVTPGTVTATTGSVAITPAAVTVNATPGSLTVAPAGSLPWSDNWTGTNGDAWSSTKWPTVGEDTDASTVQDIQGNRGRTAVGPVNDEWTAGVAANETDTAADVEATGTVYLTDIPTHAAWLYLNFRSSGDIQTGAAGRPTDAYYFRVDVSTQRNGRIFVRNSNTETQLVGDTQMGHTASTDFEFRAQVLTEGSDVRLRMRTWDQGTTEPGTWDIEHLHVSTDSGTRITTAGHFGYVHRNANTGATTISEIQLEDWTFDTISTSDAITPAAVTVNATPGTLTLAPSDWAITPGAVTVNATPGTLSVEFSNTINLTGASVSATPGSVSLAPGSVAITPAAEAVNVTPGSLVVTAGSVAVTPDQQTINVTPGTVSLAVGSVAVTPAVVNVGVTPGTLTVTTGSQLVTPSSVTVNVTPSGLTVTAGQVDIVPSPVSINVTPGSVSVAPGSTGIVPDSQTINVTPGSVTVTQAQSITPSVVTVNANPGSVTLTPGSVAVTLSGASIVVTPSALTVSVAGSYDKTEALHMESDAFFSFLCANEGDNFTDTELVGALNEINGTVGIGYWEARETYFNS